ncbi:hypothetical protein GCM10008959_30030 [Deinococcus seoulensis]|uniref:Uncharacterized protein n=1 Tax=Deinococcus seoulensis TaxID=1837379 RepID=A0ABQ2RU83_9DEIO|nr:hypothetical protein [Deinococcus seoulensis]GGR65701.1 hypothetical protein GCM10008959_30030 [Deinococcus seoulensis]
MPRKNPKNTPIHAGTLPAALLAASSLEPRTAAQLLDTAQRRGQFPDADERAARHAAATLHAGTLLTRQGQGGQADPYRYTLTTTGEDTLEHLHVPHNHTPRGETVTTTNHTTHQAHPAPRPKTP